MTTTLKACKNLMNKGFIMKQRCSVQYFWTNCFILWLSQHIITHYKRCSRQFPLKKLSNDDSHCCCMVKTEPLKTFCGFKMSSEKYLNTPFSIDFSQSPKSNTQSKNEKNVLFVQWSHITVQKLHYKHFSKFIYTRHIQHEHEKR